MLFNSVCNHTLDKQIGLPCCAVVRFCHHSYDYRAIWTPLSPITITTNTNNNDDDDDVDDDDDDDDDYNDDINEGCSLSYS